MADPGALLVGLCHRHGIEVVPLVGPSSLMLALMASGLNGQSFAFVGYIPAKTEERRSALKNLERRSSAAHQTQILIETPYRNDALLADMLQCLSGTVRLCIAANLTWLTHLSHAFPTHPQFCRELPPTVQPAYDGLVIEG